MRVKQAFKRGTACYFQQWDLSIDIYYFNKLYHDYHFCCVFKEKGRYFVFEPKSGRTTSVTAEELDEMISSVQKDLSDAVIVFGC